MTLKENIESKLSAIKELLGVGLAADPAPGAADAGSDEPPAGNTAKLKDGTEIRWTGELTSGTELNAVTAAGVEPAPDGSMELEDGTILTVAGGKITGVTKAIAPEQGTSEFKAALEAAIAPLQTEIESLKTALAENKKASEKEVQSIKAAFSETVALVELMNITPAVETPKPTKHEFSKAAEMDEFEQMAESIKNAKK